MSSITGPVEVLAWHFTSADAAIDGLSALDVLRGDPSVRVLDLLIGTKEDDVIAYVETDSDGSSRAAFVELPEHGRGLIAHEDVDGLASALDLDDGGSVVVVVLEHLWAERVGSAFHAAGGRAVFDEFVAQSTIDDIIRTASMKEGA